MKHFSSVNMNFFLIPSDGSSFILYMYIFQLKYCLASVKMNLYPVSTGGGGGVFHPPICFLLVTFLFLSQFPPNLVNFPKI